MSVWQQVRLGHLVRAGGALATAALLVLLAWGYAGPGSAHAAGTGPRLVLNANGTGVSCDSPSEPSACTVPVSAPFKLSVDFLSPPAAGYIAIATMVSFPGLTWVPRSVADENVWPDNRLAVRDPNPAVAGATVVALGGLTGASPPFPVSHYEGSVVELSLKCSAEAHSFEVVLATAAPDVNPQGTAYTLPDQTQVPGQVVGQRDINIGGTTASVPISGILTVNCAVLAPPTPTPEAQAQPTATPGLPATGSAGVAGGGGVAWPLIGGLVAAAALLGTAGWQLRQRARTR